MYSGKQELSDEIIDRFNQELGYDLKIHEFDEILAGKKGGKRMCRGYGEDIRTFSYKCIHPKMEEFKNYLRNWLESHDMDCDFLMINYLELVSTEKLTESQIEDFEKEFEVKLDEVFDHELMMQYFFN